MGRLVAEIAPFVPEGKRGRPPFPKESLLRIHFMQQCVAAKPSLKPLRIPQPYADISQWLNCIRNDGLSDQNSRTQQLAL